MNKSELDVFIMPEEKPGDCLTLSDMIEYAEHMSIENRNEIIRCMGLDRRIRNFASTGDFTKATEISREHYSIMKNLVKSIIN